MAQGAGHAPDPMHHVKDSPSWEFFDRLFGHVALDLPAIPIPGINYEFQITKFMLLELLAAVLLLAIFIPIARRSRDGSLPTGSFWNLFESFLTFIREDVAKPNIGEEEADRFVPYLWTVFLFILLCNLFGMIPWLGSPTASISVTGALAFLSFLLMHLAPMIRHGAGNYFKSMWVSTGLPFLAELPISGMLFLIEMMGTAIKSFVLAVRLFANMFAGHMVLATILTFIVIVGNQGFSAIWPLVTVSSVVGVVALSLLELFVAFLQAYVFTFLTALFVGMALHHAAEHGEHAHEHGHEGHAVAHATGH